MQNIPIVPLPAGVTEDDIQYLHQHKVPELLEELAKEALTGEGVTPLNMAEHLLIYMQKRTAEQREKKLQEVTEMPFAELEDGVLRRSVLVVDLRRSSPSEPHQHNGIIPGCLYVDEEFSAERVATAICDAEQRHVCIVSGNMSPEETLLCARSVARGLAEMPCPRAPRKKIYVLGEGGLMPWLEKFKNDSMLVFGRVKN